MNWGELATARQRAVAVAQSREVRRVADKSDKLTLMLEKLELLAPLAPQFQCIRDADGLQRLLTSIQASGAVAIDTETTGLSEWRDSVVGLCIYTPGEKAAYIPVGHVDAQGQRLTTQCTTEQVAEFLRQLRTVTTVFHHAKFDVKMLYTSFGVRVPIGWDTQIAGELLNENEPHGLKALWMKYCMPRDLSAELAPQAYDKLFDDVPLATLPPDLVYIYGARDALMTWELYDFQRPFLTVTADACMHHGLAATAELYHNTELPLIDAFIDMERTGFAFDAAYAERLTARYVEERERFREQLDAMALTWDWSVVPEALVEKIGSPINWNSATQMAIVAYDLAGLPVLDAEKPRSTGSYILERWATHPAVSERWQRWAALMVAYREHAKLINTYLAGFPKLVNEQTGRIHGTFFQNGSVTGRMCVAMGTPVLRAGLGGWEWVPIEHVRAGDTVYTYDAQGHGGTAAVTWSGSTGVQSIQTLRWRAATGMAAGQVQLTLEHPVLMGDGTWRGAGTIQAGDEVQGALWEGGADVTSTLLEIVAVEAGPPVAVWDLEVETTACFIAGGVAVHNSSQQPNLQNLPRERKEIRGILRATPGYYLVSGDYSQIEPRGLAHLSGDENMLAYYREGRDLYASMAAAIWQLPYDECREVYEDGRENPEGKKRRTAVKSILLGIMYGRGGTAIAEQLGVSADEGRAIVQRFFDTFPAVKATIERVQEEAREKGYVQTFYGRKRRLPELSWPPFEVYDRTNQRLAPALEGPYVAKLKAAWSRTRVEQLLAEGRAKGWQIVDNSGRISHAERQCLNSILQGSSADITKRAMVAVARDQELRELGFRMLTSVHDEIVGEAPREFAVLALERLTEVMRRAAKLNVPIVVDGEITERWGGANLAPALEAARHDDASRTVSQSTMVG